jgi:hypothetical protein
MQKLTLTVTTACIAGLCVVSVAFAQAPAPQPDYHPSFADLMTMAVQPRHLKVGIAGKERNWDYVAYEAKELRNAFNRVGRTIPTFNNQSMPDMFAASIMPAMDKLDAAIKAKEGAAFDAAYREVTTSCNNCHTSLNHAYVVIQEPAASAYADQNLTASSTKKGGNRKP